MKKVVAVLCGLVLLSFVACGPKAPQGMPKTFPCYITLVDGGTPVADAQIILYPEQGGSLIISGQTDSKGRANITTVLASYVGKGAPEGTFKVTLHKQPVIEMSAPAGERGAMTPLEMQEHERELQAKRESTPQIIPQDCTLRDTTPIEVSVTSATSGKELAKIDVATYK